MGTCQSSGRESRYASGGDAATEEPDPLAITAAHSGLIADVESAGPDSFFTCSEDKTIALTNWKTGTVETRWTGHTRCVNRMAYGPKTQTLFSCSRDLSIRTWKSGEAEQLHEATGHTLNVAALALSDDESSLASGARDAVVKLWDASTMQEKFSAKIHRNLVTCLKWVHGEETLFAQGSEDLRLRVWDHRIGMKPAQTLEGYVYFPLCVDVSADGNYLLTGSKGFESVGCEGRLWDRRTGQMVHHFTGHEQDATSCCFLPRREHSPNPLVATASKDRTVRVWDSVTGAAVSQCVQNDCTMFTGLSPAPESSSADLYASGFSGNTFVYKIDAEGSINCVAKTDDSQMLQLQ
jgi:WD40 repeat protein